jgi:hypothetical protein
MIGAPGMAGSEGATVSAATRESSDSDDGATPPSYDDRAVPRSCRGARMAHTTGDYVVTDSGHR